MALPLFVHSSIDDMTDLTPNAMRVYMHLARRADANGVAWPSYQAIGDHCFKSVSDNPVTRKSFARRAIEELIAAGIVSKEAREREDGGQSSNGYKLSAVDSGADPMPIDTGVPNSTPMLNGHYPMPIDTPHAYKAPNNIPYEGSPISPDSVANATAHADAAPASLAASDVFRNFHDELKESKNRPEVLMRAYLYCYGPRDAPNYGRLGAFAKKVGGAGMALELMWEFLSRPPNGDVLNYLEVTFSARQHDRRKPYSPPVKDEGGRKTGYNNF